jgi:FMN-dependent NADH-azoreductase
MKLLHIDSSILGTQSATREIGAAWVAEWRRTHGDGTVVHRDLASDPLAHLTADVFTARSAAEPIEDAELRARVAADEIVLQEFIDADVVVIGAPMYNFSVPSQLKAWIDRVAVKGRTFAYGASGPAGLAGGKKIVVISSRGGVYSEGPAASFDHQETYLRSVFAFLGVTNFEFIRVEGLAMGDAKRVEAMRAAHSQILAPLKIAA